MSVVSSTTGSAESALLGAITGVDAGSGCQEMKAAGQRKHNLHFYYGDAYGHPASQLIGGIVSGYSCHSAATPFLPISPAHSMLCPGETVCLKRCTPRQLFPGSASWGAPVREICGATFTPGAVLSPRQTAINLLRSWFSTSLTSLPAAGKRTSITLLSGTLLRVTGHLILFRRIPIPAAFADLCCLPRYDRADCGRRQLCLGVVAAV